MVDVPSGPPRALARAAPASAGRVPDLTRCGIVEVHGGAWCNGDLNECQIYGEGFARAGLAVMAIDFRHAADGYPTSLADINYAIRWVKAHASELNTRADLVGIAGQSSGGHLGRCLRAALVFEQTFNHVGRGVEG